MKRISFISPVEAVRGNLSGKRKLTYAPDNNPAWNVASSERQYANNYVPRFIGAQRSKDGKTYFAVKTKSAVKMSAAMRQQNALLSVSSVIANLIMMDISTLAQLQAMFAVSYEGQSLKWSFKRWIMASVRSALSTKNDIFFNAAGMSSIIFANPYKKSHVQTAITLATFPNELLVKFWTQLADNAVTFTVAGQTGIAHSGDTFATLIAASYNTLGLVADSSTESETDVVKLGELYVNGLNGEDLIATMLVTDTVTSGYAYELGQFIGQG